MNTVQQVNTAGRTATIRRPGGQERESQFEAESTHAKPHNASDFFVIFLNLSISTSSRCCFFACWPSQWHNKSPLLLAVSLCAGRHNCISNHPPFAVFVCWPSQWHKNHPRSLGHDQDSGRRKVFDAAVWPDRKSTRLN